MHVSEMVCVRACVCFPLHFFFCGSPHCAQYGHIACLCMSISWAHSVCLFDSDMSVCVGVYICACIVFRSRFFFFSICCSVFLLLSSMVVVTVVVAVDVAVSFSFMSICRHTQWHNTHRQRNIGNRLAAAMAIFWTTHCSSSKLDNRSATSQAHMITLGITYDFQWFVNCSACLYHLSSSSSSSSFTISPHWN